MKKALAAVLTTSIAVSAVPMTAWAEEGAAAETATESNELETLEGTNQEKEEIPAVEEKEEEQAIPATPLEPATMVEEDRTLEETVEETTPAEEGVVKVGEATYKTIQAALETETSDVEITLTGDLTEDVTIPEGRTVTLDLAGHKLANSKSHAITNAGTLTITGDGTVDAGDVQGAGTILNKPGAVAHLNGGTFTGNKWYVIKNLGKMTIDGATIEQKDAKSSNIANGWYDSGNSEGKSDCGIPHTGEIVAELTIKDGTFSGGMNTVKNDDFGVLEIKNGTFTNTDGPTVLNWNEATISGGTFKVNNTSSSVIATGHLNGTGDKGETTIKGGTFTAPKDGAGNVFGYGLSSTSGGFIKIEGGKFNGSTEVAEGAPAMPSVSGGEFSQPVKQEYLANGLQFELESKEGNDKVYSYYPTKTDAQAAAKPGDTIKDTADQNAQPVKQVQVTWDANGGTLLGDREETEMYSAKGKVEAPDVSRSRYRLRGWTNEAGQYVDFNSYILSENDVEVTFTAQWKKKSSSSGGSSSSSSSDKEYSIAIDQDIDNGKVKVDPSKAEKGDKVTITVTPDKGYEISKVVVKDADGEKLEVKDKGKGEYTFTMPDSKVEIDAKFVKAEEKPETPAEAKTIILTIDQKIANVSGEYVVNDVAPIIRNERTMLPIRFIAKELGAEVAWDDALNKVTITKDDLKIELIIGSAIAVVNGENVTLDAPAFIENSRTYLPLRFVAENLGATVTWDAATQQVTIVAEK